MNYHKLLERQIRRHLQEGAQSDELARLLAAVDEAYRDADADRSAIERSLELMSAELTERNVQLQFELQERHAIEQALLQEKSEQQDLIKKLEEAHHQLLQAEKMASIGQLAAGVAHEINNPIGFVGSNMGTLREYVQSLLELIAAYESHEPDMAASIRQHMASLRAQIDLSYLRQDIPNLVRESIDGIERVRKIVQDLKDFSHVDEAQWQWADLRCGLDSTLNIVQNEIKYVAEVVKNYGDIPDVECMPSQLNQVFMNLLVNAAHAMHERRGKITVTVGTALPEAVFVEIADEGHGIAPENLKRIFDPFFTTKAIGKGTGLGLSLSYGIVKKHGGQITVESRHGVGTVFRMVLPVRQPAKPPD
ncbi:ATP-binding protein [Aquabacterium sp. CECT 9606]|uniref:ATP-binding protein n=1 Tax=Aquabacterium sp. CECT 9606 TaxID=2845822 RepID=UPI001E2AB90C|nr:ATP-binding protein [Aquabacterium sp. CECT 9606]CAH0348053.1 Sporulation kinase E [Aquabacterium sp. CECT 9606]